jgi:hypothetical protein
MKPLFGLICLFGAIIFFVMGTYLGMGTLMGVKISFPFDLATNIWTYIVLAIAFLTSIDEFWKCSNLSFNKKAGWKNYIFALSPLVIVGLTGWIALYCHFSKSLHPSESLIMGLLLRDDVMGTSAFMCCSCVILTPKVVESADILRIKKEPKKPAV